MPKLYEIIVRNKFIAVDAKNKEEFLKCIQNHAEYVKELVNNSEVKYHGDGTGDDYAMFSTTNPIIAEQYGFYENEDEDDEEWNNEINDNEDEREEDEE